MKVLGWTVLTLAFVDELLAMAAASVWGAATGGPVLAVVMPVLVVVVWALFASPRAPFGGPVVRPVVQVLVFGLASWGLWDAGHPGWALAMLVFSVVVNGLALLPWIRELAEGAPLGNVGSGR